MEFFLLAANPLRVWRISAQHKRAEPLHFLPLSCLSLVSFYLEVVVGEGMEREIRPFVRELSPLLILTNFSIQ
jgi:hypothetical protein